MTFILLYAATAVVFLALDAVMLTRVIAPLFRAELGDKMLETPKLGASVGFYALYIAGLCWLVSWPALHANSNTALWNGAVLGAVAYGTYEMTNYATLRGWSRRMVVVDWAWGTVLTGLSAWIGVLLTRWLLG